jgi:hypothetical protein
VLLRRRPPRRPLTPFAPSSGGTLSETIYGYDDQTGRLASISHGGSTATYDWSSTVGGLPAGISYSGAGLTGIRTPDAEGRLDKIAWELDDGKRHAKHPLNGLAGVMAVPQGWGHEQAIHRSAPSLPQARASRQAGSGCARV